MSRLFSIVFLILTLALSIAMAQGGHEYAPLKEQSISYEDWTFPSLKGEKVNLREWMQGKKLVLVAYFAPWCQNWRYEAPFLARLQEKYGEKGLGIIGVSEYASIDDARRFFGERGAPYPVVVESETREARDTTTHFKYRQVSDDKRRWGSPYHIFLDPATVKEAGGVLTEKVWVVNGELIEADVEKFISERLDDSPAAGQ